jgi:hypothetical protein
LQVWSSNGMKRKARTLSKPNKNRSRLHLRVGAPSAGSLAEAVAGFSLQQQKENYLTPI